MWDRRGQEGGAVVFDDSRRAQEGRKLVLEGSRREEGGAVILARPRGVMEPGQEVSQSFPKLVNSASKTFLKALTLAQGECGNNRDCSHSTGPQSITLDVCIYGYQFLPCRSHGSKIAVH